MSLAVRAKPELQIEKDRGFFQIRQKEELYTACECGAVEVVKKIIQSNPELIGLCDDEGPSALELAVINRQSAVLDCFIDIDLQKTIKVLSKRPGSFFLAIARDMFSFVAAVTSYDSSLLKITSEEGESPFFYACKHQNLPLMKLFYSLDPKIIKRKNSLRQTPFLYLALSKEAGAEGLAWLIQATAYQVASNQEARAFVEHVKANLFFDETLIIKVVNKESLPYFLSSMQHLEQALESEEVLDYLQDLVAPYPSDFHYEGLEEEKLEGDALIEFCVRNIPDEPAVANPFRELHRIFFSLKKVEYVALMSFGQIRASSRAANNQKFKDLKDCRELFKKIKQETPSKKKYLVKILKHLTSYLRTESGSLEKMTFLKDLTAAAPHCYTHYSTVLRSIYSRITGDVLLSRMHVDEGYSSAFEHKLSAFLKQAFCRKLRDIHGSMNIHCHYLAQQFLKEENYPLPEEPIMDEQVHLAATLLLFRQEKLGIAFEEEDENIVQSDQLLYEDTKRLYFAMLDRDLLNQAFIFEQTLNLLIEGLSSENSENFLAHLTTWLESKKISTHAVLRLNDSGDYIIRRSGVLEILSRMPRKMVL